MMMKWGMHIRILILRFMFLLIIIQKVLIFELSLICIEIQFSFKSFIVI